MKKAFLAFLAGAAMVLAFAPTGLYPVAFLCFALLARLWTGARPREALREGFAFGMGLFLAGVSWVYVSLHDFGGMPAPIAGAATLGFCALLAAFPAAAGWAQARIRVPDLARVALVIPAAWTLAEWLRSWVLTGFPWLSAGYGAAGWPLEGFAPVGGVFLASFVTVSIGGLLWAAWVGRQRAACIAAIVALVAGGEALRHVQWTEREGAPVSVALLQGNIAQELKFRGETYSRILETYERLSEESSARIVVLPETALPRLIERVDPAYLARLQAIARRNDGVLLLGVPVRAGSRYYNSVVALGPSPTRTYDKVHLVPFGEFVPPALGWVMQLMSIPLSDFSRGAEDAPPIEGAGQRISINVCYEDAFGDELARRAARATLLVNASNVAWFGDSLAPAQHFQMARLRALEAGRAYLAATNTGITGAIDRDGRVIARLPAYTEGRLETTVQGYSGSTPYMRFLDWPIVAFCLLVFLVAAAASRR